MLLKAFQSFKLLWIILIALALRLIIAPWWQHGDVDAYYWWGMDIWKKGFLGFYDRNINNAIRPNYLPVIPYFLWVMALVHEALWQVFWFLNKYLPVFPGRLIFWLESTKGWYFLNKLPAIIADLGIIWVLFKFSKRFSQKINYLPLVFLAFVPAFWYNSSLWGQTDSIYGFFMLGAFYLLYTGRLTLSAFFYTLALLTKPTSFFALPVFAAFWLTQSNFKKAVSVFLICILFAVLAHLPFHPHNFFAWALMFYSHNIGGEMPIITANAFNFWGLIFGFSNTLETTSFLGLPANLVGYGIFGAITTLVIINIFKHRKNIPFEKVLLFSALVTFAGFMFLPRIHERYLYPTLILLLPLVGTDKRIRNLFLGLSTIHLINMYHYFWVPKVDFLITVFNNPEVEKVLIIGNIIMFIVLFRICFQRSAK